MVTQSKLPPEPDHIARVSVVVIGEEGTAPVPAGTGGVMLVVSVLRDTSYSSVISLPVESTLGTS